METLPAPGKILEGRLTLWKARQDSQYIGIGSGRVSFALVVRM